MMYEQIPEIPKKLQYIDWNKLRILLYGRFLAQRERVILFWENSIQRLLKLNTVIFL